MWPWTVTALGRGAQPLEPRPHARRLERRLGGRRRDGHVRRRAGLRRRRLDPLPGRALRPVRHQAPRDRISLGPDHHDGWNGLTVYGPLARTVRDAALFLDATADGGPDAGWAAALDEPAGKLRVAVSLKPPQGSLARLAPTSAGRSRRPRTCCARLATRSSSARSTCRSRRPQPRHALPRGIDHDAATLPRRERLERNTRKMTRLGACCRRAGLRRRVRAEPRLAARLNSVFEVADVVLMPMLPGQAPRITDLTGRGATWSFNRAATEVAYTAPWNLIGQPAASVPAGFDGDGLPLAVQLCGRAGDEVTLLRLSAQLEEARPWAAQRPPIDVPAALAVA